MSELSDLLSEIDFGSRTAEDEIRRLGNYFVETAQWNRIRTGKKDIVYGPKGSGKSAIYGVLVQRAEELQKHGIVIKTAEQSRGEPIFAELVAEPPQSEEEWRVLWRAYFIRLVAEVLEDYAVAVDAAKAVYCGLEEEGLREGKGLRGALQAARRFARRVRTAESIEGNVGFEGVTAGAKVGAKVELPPERKDALAAAAAVASLLEAANKALEEADLEVWVLLDRLDAAFLDPQIEGPAIRALMRVYLDFTTFEQVTPKIFLRMDIWEEISEKKGFREGSHVVRDETISWNRDALLNLAIRRVLENECLLDWFAVERDAVLTSIEAQESLFERLFEDGGSGEAGRLAWALKSIEDGNGRSAPRELIDLLNQLRDKQLERLQVGRPGPVGKALFEPAVCEMALREVSMTHLTRTLYAEIPKVKDYVEILRGGPVAYTAEELDALWGSSVDTSAGVVETLVKAGFFRRPSASQAGFEVAMLYRPALELLPDSESEGN